MKPFRHYETLSRCSPLHLAWFKSSFSMVREISVFSGSHILQPGREQWCFGAELRH